VTERGAVRLLILDACVLIDYCETDQTVLGTVSASVGSVHVASTVFDEVDRLDVSGAAALGIQIVEPPLALLQAAAVKRGALSVQDHLCLLLAKTNGWTCVSNDTALRRACEREGVPVMWGLQMMGLAVQAGALPASTAQEIAWRIHECNRYVTRDIVEAFVRKYVQA
jgi:rRNA-processing protein FCF1